MSAWRARMREKCWAFQRETCCVCRACGAHPRPGRDHEHWPRHCRVARVLLTIMRPLVLGLVVVFWVSRSGESMRCAGSGCGRAMSMRSIAGLDAVSEGVGLWVCVLCTSSSRTANGGVDAGFGAGLGSGGGSGWVVGGGRDALSQEA